MKFKRWLGYYKYLIKYLIINDILSEGTEANIPNSIKSIAKNMESTSLSQKTTLKAMKENSNSVRNEFSQKSYSFVNADKNTVDALKTHSRSQKRTLKQDISDLLKIFANERKNLSEVKFKSSTWNTNRDNEKSIVLGSNSSNADYVTMKEIQSIPENQF